MKEPYAVVLKIQQKTGGKGKRQSYLKEHKLLQGERERGRHVNFTTSVQVAF